MTLFSVNGCLASHMMTGKRETESEREMEREQEG
jgi:hypothetical protein